MHTQNTLKLTMQSIHWNYFVRFSIMLYETFSAETRLTVCRGAIVNEVPKIEGRVCEHMSESPHIL